MKPSVLILCTANSCRSQMAEGIAKHLYSTTFTIFSAGTHPSIVHPLAIEVMKEIGIDISTHHSKSVNKFKEHAIDFILTVCGQAEENCPFFPGTAKRIHWGFEDPAPAKGTKEEILTQFRSVRDAIFQKCKTDWEYTFK